MALGTKNRLHETGVVCRTHLQELHADQADLVAEFIVEIEGTGSDRDLAAWNRFSDLRRDPNEMKDRAEAAYQQWLAGN